MYFFQNKPVDTEHEIYMLCPCDVRCHSRWTYTGFKLIPTIEISLISFNDKWFQIAFYRPDDVIEMATWDLMKSPGALRIALFKVPGAFTIDCRIQAV